MFNNKNTEKKITIIPCDSLSQTHSTSVFLALFKVHVLQGEEESTSVNDDKQAEDAQTTQQSNGIETQVVDEQVLQG